MGQGLVFPLAGKLGTAISVVGNFEELFSLSLSLSYPRTGLEGFVQVSDWRWCVKRAGVWYIHRGSG